MSGSSPLRDLAHVYGVATDYHDWQGRPVEVSDASITAVLTALGVDADDPAAALTTRWQQQWRKVLAPCIVLTEGDRPVVEVHVTAGDAVELSISCEDGRPAPAPEQIADDTPPREIDGRWIGQASFRIPDGLPAGYHTLTARVGESLHSATLIVTPRRLTLPAAVATESGYGVAVQLYSVRSRTSWGVGDLTDLADLATWVGDQHGADFVLVNPLHAAEPTTPLQPSPYLPSSRRFTNPLYLRPEAVPEYADVRGEVRKRIRRAQRSMHNDSKTIDRDTAWRRKRRTLQHIAAVPRRPARELAFEAYRRREGDALRDFATWCAIVDLYGHDRAAWPAALQHPDSRTVIAFRSEHAERITFHAWLQWQLDEQLAGAQQAARTAGMAIGVMKDLAVGVDPGGADAWALQDVLATGVTVGAPPDAYNQVGQDWQQPPWRPDRLEQLSYAPFRAMIASILRHAGAVRIDHILGLFRLWWIPAGVAANAGTYVRYDYEAMIGVLCLEASRVGAVVIGEDLGTVEPGVRDVLRERGILGTSLLWFEADDDGGPLPAERWRELSLASVTTHDLPATAGYLDDVHVRLRERLGVLTRPVDQELAAARAGRAVWFDELRRRGLLDDHPSAAGAPGRLPCDDDLAAPAPIDPDATHGADTIEIITALHRYLALTPARLRVVYLTDAVGDRTVQNQPGTDGSEYPNWQVPLTGPDGTVISLEDVMTNFRAAALLDAMRPPG